MRNWNRKTSSSKLSSVSTSFSTAAKGNFNHNRRTNSKVPQNVDPTKTAFNKILTFVAPLFVESIFIHECIMDVIS